MQATDVLDLIRNGESSTVQFKKTVNDAHSISQEMVAFANSKGGLIVIGVDDKTGKIIGLSYDEIQSINALLSNSATNNVIPQIKIFTETVPVEFDNVQQRVILATIEEGLNKPYKDKNGAIWDKNGSDKRRVTSNEEISRLLQGGRYLHADEMPINGASTDEIDKEVFELFLKRKFKQSLDEIGLEIPLLLSNLNLAVKNNFTLAGLLLFCKNREKYKPQFSIQCLSVYGTMLNGNDFIDNEPAFDGTLKRVFDNAIGFIDRNIHKMQSGPSFNSEAVWEVPYEVFEELIVNALIHREYFINATVKIFVFTDRIEIMSPGCLPNSLNVENVINGISVQRNPVLQSVGQFVLPYKGLGTGIGRALSLYPDIQFINDTSKNSFTAIIKRPAV